MYPKVKKYFSETIVHTTEEFQNRTEQPSKAPASFRLSTLPVNDEFLIENSNKIPNYLQNIWVISSFDA